MKTKSIIFVGLILFGLACGSRHSGPRIVNSLTFRDSLCFMKVEGFLSRDTTAVRLLNRNGKITGEYVWYPAEKDKRVGTLDGTLIGDTIRAKWNYMQEGNQHMEDVKFYFDSNKLVQRGRFADSLTFERVNCNKMPLRIRFKVL